MKAFRITAAAALLISVLSVNTYSQVKSSDSTLNRFYVQAGYSFLSVKSFDNLNNFNQKFGFMGSVSYQLIPKVRLDLKYVYSGEMYDYHVMIFRNNPPPNVYKHSVYDGFISHRISLKADYFLSSKQSGILPYLSGGISSAIERVKTYDELNYIGMSDTTFYNFNSRSVYGEHTRVLIGPELGAGLFIALGKFNFQQELTFSTMFSFIKDRNYRERSFNLHTGIVYKF
jgi:hypothetical protein